MSFGPDFCVEVSRYLISFPICLRHPALTDVERVGKHILPCVVTWSDFCYLWPGVAWKWWEVIGWPVTSTSDTVKPSVKGWMSIAASQKARWDHAVLTLWDGLLNGMMTSKCGLYRFLFNLLNFLRNESSRQDYTLLQQIIQTC